MADSQGNGRTWTPSQDEVDAVAHFVEAVEELRKSPFFIEEYRNLSVSWLEMDNLKHAKGRFPDDAHVKAMLIPFRRIWQQGNPSYFRYVANILKRPGDRALARIIDFLVFTDRGSTTAHSRSSGALR